MNNLTQNSGFLNPTNFEQAMTLAEMLSQSDLVPKNYKGKQFDIVVAMQMGYEVGLKPLQALQNISVVNGKPTLWGDAVVAICQGSGMLEDITEEVTDDYAKVTVKRVGQEPHSVTFSREDAQKAGLWGKSGTWQQYPKRMMKNRARAFALRDKFADVLSGFGITEEEKDRVIDEVKAPKDVTPQSAPQGLNALVNNAVAKLDASEDAVDVAKLADDIAKADNNDKLANLAATISKHRDAGKISDEERLELIDVYKKRNLYFSLTNDVKQATLDSGNEVRALLHSKRASLSEEDFATLDGMLDDVLNGQAGV